jgi:hypothetical protein
MIECVIVDTGRIQFSFFSKSRRLKHNLSNPQEPSRQKMSIVLPSTVTSELPFCTDKGCPIFQCFSPLVIMFTTR